MEVKGKVIVVTPLQTGEGRNGMWKKQEYVLEYDQNSQYPRRMMFNLWGDKIDQYNIQEGQWLNIGFDIDCREYNGKWYNDIRAWKVEPTEDGTQELNAGFTPASSTMLPPTAQPIDETSDLPF